MQGGDGLKKRGAHSLCTPFEALACLCGNAEEAPQAGRNLRHRIPHEKSASFQTETSIENYGKLIFTEKEFSYLNSLNTNYLS